MTSPRAKLAMLVLLALATIGASPAMRAAGLVPEIQYDQRLGAALPLAAQLRDESGRIERLGTFTAARPAILVFAYFECPNLCGTVLDALTVRLRRIDLAAGRDFDVIVVSIDPRDAPAAAARKKQVYVAAYDHPGASAGWHFLTGDAAAIAQLTQAVGFHYVHDPASGQFAHPAGAVLITPAGRISRYLPGVDFPERELRSGLIDAAGERIGPTADRFWLRCFHYDAAGRYGPAVANALQASGVVSVALLGGAIGVWLRRERRKRRRHA